jgi:peptidoglycan/LPS O-acetylase OafA/YrhL
MTFDIGLYRGRRGHAVLTSPALLALGGISYTLYLYHDWIFRLLAPHTVSLWHHGAPLIVELAALSAVVLPPTLLISGLLFLLIEKPFMRLSRAYQRRFGQPSG